MDPAQSNLRNTPIPQDKPGRLRLRRRFQVRTNGRYRVDDDGIRRGRGECRSIAQCQDSLLQTCVVRPRHQQPTALLPQGVIDEFRDQSFPRPQDRQSVSDVSRTRHEAKFIPPPHRDNVSRGVRGRPIVRRGDAAILHGQIAQLSQARRDNGTRAQMYVAPLGGHQQGQRRRPRVGRV